MLQGYDINKRILRSGQNGQKKGQNGQNNLPFPFSFIRFKEHLYRYPFPVIKTIHK